ERRPHDAEDLLGAAAADEFRQQAVEDDAHEPLAVMAEGGEHLVLAAGERGQLLGQQGEGGIGLRLGLAEGAGGAFAAAVLAALAQALLIAELAGVLEVALAELRRLGRGGEMRRLEARHGGVAVERLLAEDAVEDEPGLGGLVYAAHAAPSLIQLLI